MRAIRSRALAAAMMAALTVGITAAQTSPTTELDRMEIRVETEAIPFKVVYEFSREVGPGRLVTHRKGVPGKAVRTFTVTFKNGKVAGKELMHEEVTKPADELILMGKKGFQTSRSSFTRGRVVTMHATAYDPSPITIPGTTGRTANGMRARYGVVAVDPRVIPLGTLVFVEGYGFAIAADTGGAIKGNRIDLCYNERSTALRFGRRNVRVHVFGKA